MGLTLRMLCTGSPRERMHRRAQSGRCPRTIEFFSSSFHFSVSVILLPHASGSTTVQAPGSATEISVATKKTGSDLAGTYFGGNGSEKQPDTNVAILHYGNRIQPIFFVFAGCRPQFSSSLHSAQILTQFNATALAACRAILLVGILHLGVVWLRSQANFLF